MNSSFSDHSSERQHSSLLPFWMRHSSGGSNHDDNHNNKNNMDSSALLGHEELVQFAGIFPISRKKQKRRAPLPAQNDSEGSAFFDINTAQKRPRRSGLPSFMTQQHIRQLDQQHSSETSRSCSRKTTTAVITSPSENHKLSQENIRLHNALHLRLGESSLAAKNDKVQQVVVASSYSSASLPVLSNGDASKNHYHYHHHQRPTTKWGIPFDDDDDEDESLASASCLISNNDRDDEDRSVSSGPSDIDHDDDAESTYSITSSCFTAVLVDDAQPPKSGRIPSTTSSSSSLPSSSLSTNLRMPWDMIL